MSKPTRNRVFCPDCGRNKMLFETEKEALLFIKFNGKDIDWHGRPLRVYHCPACAGYHISSHEATEETLHRTEKMLNAFHSDFIKKLERKGAVERMREEAFFDIILPAPKDIILGSKKDFHKYLKEKFPGEEGAKIEAASQICGNIRRSICYGNKCNGKDVESFVQQLKTKWENE